MKENYGSKDIGFKMAKTAISVLNSPQNPNLT
jgi:hypothetical protein